MGFWQDLTGDSAADASRAAAADTYAKQQSAIRDLSAYGDTYAQKYSDLAQGYNPYVQTGYTANNQFAQLLADPSSVRGLPGYQFALDQGLNAVDRGAAARSGVQNGATVKAEQRYGTGLAEQTYGNQFARLMAANQAGQGALGAQNATIGTGLQGQLNTRLTGYGGQMQAAGTIGQGDIAAANAKAAGTQNLFNAGLKLGGMALGSFGGGGSSFSSLLGGAAPYTGVYGAGAASGGNNGGVVWGY